VTPPTELLWNERALDDLARQPRPMVDRVVRAMERYVATGHGDVRLLQGAGGEFRLRVGDWRVRFTDVLVTRPAEPPATGAIQVREVEVLRVLHRSRAYRDL
jgi:mRNA interferase RelE/StbE